MSYVDYDNFWEQTKQENNAFSQQEVLLNRIKVKDWVIEQHKLALSRLGDAIETGDLAAIQGRWSVYKRMTEPHSHG